MEKRLGHLNGDIPRYFDWNEKARRTRGSRKYRANSWSSDSQGRKRGKSLRTGHRKVSRHPRKGLSKHVLKFASFKRLSTRNLRKETASAADNAAVARSIRSTAGVAKSSPPLPNIKRY